MTNPFKSASKTDPRHLDFTFDQGTSFYFDYKPLDVNGVRIDTTGWSFVGTFKTAFDRSDRSHYDGTTVLNFSAEAGNVINDTANKRFVVLFRKDVSSGIRCKGTALEGVYDFDLTSPDGTTLRAIHGAWTMTREVTQ